MEEEINKLAKIEANKSIRKLFQFYVNETYGKNGKIYEVCSYYKGYITKFEDKEKALVYILELMLKEAAFF